MKKIALVFIIAVFVPSLLLAWLAVRSLRDQELVVERQQSLLYQGVADSLAKEADKFLAMQQDDFGHEVEKLLGSSGSADLAVTFDEHLRKEWPLAEVGFVVTTSGVLSCPTVASSPVAREFYADNGKFVCNIQPAQVYNGNLKMSGQLLADNENNGALNNLVAQNSAKNTAQAQIQRIVIPQQQGQSAPSENTAQPPSKLAPEEAEFRQLIGDSTEGTMARFLNNKLKILLWHRSPRDSHLIFGAQLSLPRVKQGIVPVVAHLDSSLRDTIAVAVLDEDARPVALSRNGFQANWKHPFVATELGEALPHWEMAVYLLDPAKLTASARTLRLTLGLLIAVLLLAIGVGGWLIVTDLQRQLTLNRQKTNFVSNVSHELKTPLTSIRMFAELLAENRVNDPLKRQSYLNIITAETSRLTRLINNVLDFSRLERGEKKYNFQPCNLVSLVRETVETYRPHLEAGGFECHVVLPDAEIKIPADRDALSQVLVNLLSNAEKYSETRKEICVEMECFNEPLPHVDVRILDRGSGVPRDCGEKIFEQFYRAHDSLSSGIQGSGLGLTLARQIARAHQGEVLHSERDGGGSCFVLRLPLPNSPSPTVA